MAGVRSPSLYSLLLISSLLLASQSLVSSEKVAKPPIVDGLSWNYYWLSCPRVENIVKNHLKDVFEKENGTAPGILRLFFHDCFPQGCDGSILLNSVGEAEDEKTHPANIGIREKAVQAIEDLRALIRRQCLRVVSCSDILVIAAREAVRQLGGPDFDVPLGRKDGLRPNKTAANNLPPPSFRTDELIQRFKERNFDATEMVALSGAHTFGRAHCASITDRLEESDPPIDPQFKKQLLIACPPNNFKENDTVILDLRTPHKFDNIYYINLLNRQGVFISDQDLAHKPETQETVNTFASSQKEFYDKFANAFVKLSQLDVLTNDEGEVRKSCFAPNGENSKMASVVEEVVELAEKI